MPTFTVSLCRDTVEFVDVEIEADTEEEAKKIALSMATGSQKHQLYWEADDTNAKEPAVNETFPYAKYW